MFDENHWRSPLDSRWVLEGQGESRCPPAIVCIPPLPPSTAGLRAVQYFCLFCVSQCPLYKEERIYEKVLATQFTGEAVQFLRIRGLKFETKRKRSH